MKNFKQIIYLLIIPISIIHTQTVTSSISTPFGERIFEGTVYVSQSEYSLDAKAIILIKMPDTYSDYMPIVFHNEYISKFRVGKSVYFNIYVENNNYYANNFTYIEPTDYSPISLRESENLIAEDFIDIHNTIDGVDHDQIKGGFNSTSHRLGHIWNARIDDKIRQQSRSLSSVSRSRTSPLRPRQGNSSSTSFHKSRFKFSKEELDSYGLKEICYDKSNNRDCSVIWYIDRSLYIRNSDLFDSNNGQPVYYKNETTSINGINFQLITDVSRQHRH